LTQDRIFLILESLFLSRKLGWWWTDFKQGNRSRFTVIGSRLKKLWTVNRQPWTVTKRFHRCYCNLS